MTAISETLSYTKHAFETCHLPALSSDEEPALKNVLSAKLCSNLDVLRKSVVNSKIEGKEHERDADSKGDFARFQDQFADIQYTVSMVHHSSMSALKEQYAKHMESQKPHRFSVDFDQEINSSPETQIQIEDVASESKNDDQDDEKLAELRNRLLGKHQNHTGDTSEPGSSMEKQIQVQNNIQEELLSDMSQLVSGLKQGAEAFQAALDDDSTVLKATELGLQATSRSLIDLGGKLKKYHNSKVGILFYLTCLLFMFISLLVTYLIIKIFPKM
ncbi:LAFA_0C03180g1_1 [Lachancea sp. 'fantastica']|nr:LAFA_0C03180g1_1 [Lachancea sp. 'fantastica']